MRRNILLSYIDRSRHDHRKRMMLGSVLCFLGIIVAFTVYWQLRGTGISMTNETFCGLEEHTHTDDCYEYVLVCGYDDNTLETTDTSEAAGTSEATSTSESTDASEASNSTEAHVHTDDCYELQLVCGLEEHTHTAACLIDLTADVEDASVWKSTLPDLTGSLRIDIVSIARSQLGYTESTANYELGEDESTHYGYTRYGAWYGNEYGDWDGMFAAFCLNYAGIDEEEFPLYSGAYAWVIALGDLGEYEDAADYTPVAGDLVFFDTDDDGKADRVGVVTEVDETDENESADDSIDGDTGDETNDDVTADDEDTDKEDVDTDDEIGVTDTADEGTDDNHTAGSITVIEGNYTDGETDCVCENVYSLTDATIAGYGVIPEQKTEEDGSAGDETSEADDADMDETADSDANTTTLEYAGDDYVVTVTYGEDAALPENTSLWVYEYLQESGTYLARYAEVAELYGWDEDDDDSDDSDDSDADATSEDSSDGENSDADAASEDSDADATSEDSSDGEDSDTDDVNNADDTNGTDDTDDTANVRLFNISLVDESGNELEPSAAVHVVITYLDQETESDSYTIIHFAEDGTEVIEAETEYEDGTQIVTFELESFSEVMGIEANGPGEGGTGGGGGNNPFNPGGQTSSGDPSEAIYVWYDRVTLNGTALTAQNDNDGIESVTLDGDSVPHGDGSSSDYQNSTEGLEIKNPYENSGQTVSIVVTPESGYYITFISINCCTSGNATSCDSYSKGDAYSSSFTVSNTGAITINVTLYASNGFHHNDQATNYFILIAVSTIPSPLYVEYDYGDIVDYIDGGTATSASSAFSTAIGWTATNSSNYYGDGYNDDNADTSYIDSNGNEGYGVMTDDTQYKYAYQDGSETVATNWTHYANTVTDGAKAQAAAAGYIFAGWKAEYYTSVTVASNSSNYNPSGYQNYYNNWTYTFSSSYGESTYDEGDKVTLTTNVRLIAQWVPIGVTVTKTVTGLSGTDLANESHNYTLQLQVASTDTNGSTTWANYGDAITLTVTGDGTASTIFYPLPTGTYRVVETGGNDNLTTYTTIYYITVSTDGTVTVSSTDYDDYTESTVTTTTTVSGVETTTETTVLLSGTLALTNSYSETQITADVVLKKVDENGNTLSGAVFTLTDSTNNTTTLSATGSNGTVSLGTLTAGSTYTLTETTAPDGYSLLSGSITFTVNSASSLTINDGTNASTKAAWEVDSNGDIVITVVNSTSPVMPSTGGGGDGRFHLFGMSLILLAILGLCGYKNISETKMALADGADESIYRPPRKGRSPDKRKRKAILREMPKRGESRAGPDG